MKLRTCGLLASSAGDVKRALNSEAFWNGRQEIEVLLSHPGVQPSRAICPARVLCSPGTAFIQGTTFFNLPEKLPAG